MTPFHSLPCLRRPREKLQAFGVEALQLEELVAIILGSGSSTHDVLSLSSQVGDKLRKGESSLTQLISIPGIGKAKAAEVVAALHLSSALTSCQKHPLLSDPQKIYQACYDLINLPQEQLVVFYLTVRNQEIARETISIGTATASLVHPREVFRAAIVHNASHIVLAHNHPSGDPSPSRADGEVTRQVVEAGKKVGIELIDHVVCASSGYVSLRNSSPELFL